MIIIRPAIVDTFTTNVPDESIDLWASGTAYTVGQTVRYANSIWEALTPTTGDQPDLNPDKWLRLRAENKWAMFTDQISDRTVNADLIDVSLDPGIINSIALFNLSASEVFVSLDDPIEGNVYENTIPLIDDSGVNNWYAYYFEPISRKRDLVLTDLPPYSAATLSVEIRFPDQDAKCGLMKVGRLRTLGAATFGTSVGILDYTRKERDTFGRPIVVERNFAKRVSYDVTLDTTAVNMVQRTLSDFRAIPVVWIGDPDREETITYGFFKDFSIVLDNFTTSSASIDVEGLI